MTVYRKFRTAPTDVAFTITEVGKDDTHPMNWIDGSTDASGAWYQARCQDKPVVFTAMDGTSEVFEGVFDPNKFERAVYSGYVSYGLSMTDGYYAPMDFEAWVVSFRNDPARELNGENDTPQYVKDALPTYLAATS